MLRIDKVQTIGGVQVYGDEVDPTLFYVIGEQPTFRRDQRGRPIFKYLKYRRPRPNPNGGNGGGFAVFDVEFAVSEAKRAEVVEVLRGQVPSNQKDRVRLGTITWQTGRTSLNLESVSGELVTKVFNPGAPSLYGNNVTPFTVEVPEMGATLFAEALKGDGGFVQVVYQMNGWVKLPPITGHGTFHADKLYTFIQDAKDDAGCGSDTYEDIVKQKLVEHDVIDVSVDSGTGADPKVVDRIREAIYSTVQDVAARKLGEQIEGYTGDRSVYEDYETIRRGFTNETIYDFTYDIKENTAVLWPFNPQGTLPNITTMVDNEGKPIRWEDHYAEVDLDDPFFRTLSVKVRPNAPFATTPVHSIDVHLEYQGDKKEVEDFHFDDPDQIETFTRYRKGDNVDYTYSYEINYDTSSKTFKAGPFSSSDTELTINAADTGVLSLEVLTGNLDPEEVTSAAVTLRYEPSAGEPLEEQVVISQGAPAAKVEKVILEQWDRPVTYSVDYRMADGKVVTRGGGQTRSRRLFVNSPFTDVASIGVRAAGSMAEIETIFLDLTYTDEANDYTRSTPLSLNAESPFFDWRLPVIDAESGVVSYSGTIRRADGTVEEIPLTTATSRTIVVGEKLARLLEISVLGDLIDWTTVSLIKVAVKYRPDEPEFAQALDFILTKDRVPEAQTIEIADPTRTTYDYTVTYHVPGGPKRVVEVTGSTDQTIVIEPLPALV